METFLSWPVRLPTVEQPACKIPENLTVGSHELVGANCQYPMFNTGCRVANTFKCQHVHIQPQLEDKRGYLRPEEVLPGEVLADHSLQGNK